MVYESLKLAQLMAQEAFLTLITMGPADLYHPYGVRGIFSRFGKVQGGGIEYQESNGKRSLDLILEGTPKEPTLPTPEGSMVNQSKPPFASARFQIEIGPNRTLAQISYKDGKGIEHATSQEYDPSCIRDPQVDSLYKALMNVYQMARRGEYGLKPEEGMYFSTKEQRFPVLSGISLN